MGDDGTSGGFTKFGLAATGGFTGDVYAGLIATGGGGSWSLPESSAAVSSGGGGGRSSSSTRMSLCFYKKKIEPSYEKNNNLGF